MLWLKVAIPVVMATVGAGAIVAAGQESSTTTVSTSQVWIDSPQGEVPFAPGEVTVSAHATADASITGLQLLVDGKEVVTDSDLDRDEKLAYGELAWNADVGEHVLVVQQVGGTGAKSAPVEVFVAEGAEPAPTPSTTTTSRPGETTTSSTEPGETTTSSTSSTTTTTAPGDVGPTAPPEGDDTVPDTRPPATVPPTRPPTTTTTRPAKPVIDSAAFSGTPLVYTINGCPYRVVVSARIRNATDAEVVVAGPGKYISMTQSGSTWTATITSGFDSSDQGTYTVYVAAYGEGGDVQRTVGTLTIKLGCPKD